MPVPGGLEGIIEACPGGGEQHRSLSRGVEQNRSLSRGVEQNRSLSGGGGWGIYKSVPGRWRYNVSLSRGAFIYCPGGGGGGGGGGLRLQLLQSSICRGVRLNNQYYYDIMELTGKPRSIASSSGRGQKAEWPTSINRCWPF